MIYTNIDTQTQNKQGDMQRQKLTTNKQTGKKNNGKNVQRTQHSKLSL